MVTVHGDGQSSQRAFAYQLNLTLSGRALAHDGLEEGSKRTNERTKEPRRERSLVSKNARALARKTITAPHLRRRPDPSCHLFCWGCCIPPLRLVIPCLPCPSFPHNLCPAYRDIVPELRLSILLRYIFSHMRRRCASINSPHHLG